MTTVIQSFGGESEELTHGKHLEPCLALYSRKLPRVITNSSHLPEGSEGGSLSEGLAQFWSPPLVQADEAKAKNPPPPRSPVSSGRNIMGHFHNVAESLKWRRPRAVVAKVSVPPFGFGPAGAHLREDFKRELCTRWLGLLTNSN